jgi:trk system potassium uptake protein TrkA
MKILILGCGRVGAMLARHLSNDNHHVTILDTSSDAFRRLGPKFKGHKVVGSGLDQDILRKSGIEEADAFVAVTQGDNTNIMAAQIARNVFSVKKVMTRLYDPIRAEAYRDFGIETICTTNLAAGIFEAALTDDSTTASWRADLEAIDQRMRETTI